MSSASQGGGACPLAATRAWGLQAESPRVHVRAAGVRAGPPAPGRDAVWEPRHALPSLPGNAWGGLGAVSLVSFPGGALRHPRQLPTKSSGSQRQRRRLCRATPGAVTPTFQGAPPKRGVVLPGRVEGPAPGRGAVRTPSSPEAPGGVRGSHCAAADKPRGAQRASLSGHWPLSPRPAQCPAPPRGTHRGSFLLCFSFCVFFFF